MPKLQDATVFADTSSSAGLGGMVVFHITAKDCVAPPACEQVKECMAEAAKKAFMGSAIMGAAATGADEAPPATSAAPSPITLAPAFVMWPLFATNSSGSEKERIKSRTGSFLELDLNLLV
ncbi:unnamed protein product [Durusdinium trenchii]|uniref:Uncharacterized protein n=1 Tax=Durusdinium trenchii TaxID=1381693 RepID=A0ABP0RRS0_9DINO